LDITNETSIVFFPVNDNSNLSDFNAGGSHWSLLVLDLDQLTFYHFDSCNQSNLQAACQLAKAVYSSFSTATSRMLPLFSLMPVQNCPTQKNGSDCGLFLLLFALDICVRRNKESPQSCEMKSLTPLDQFFVASEMSLWSDSQKRCDTLRITLRDLIRQFSKASYEAAFEN